MNAERALLHDAARTAFHFGVAPGGDVGIDVGALGPVELAGVIRAGHFAVAAADAAIVIHHDETVFAMVGGLHRAHFDARRILAVQARAAEEEGLAVLHLIFDDDVPRLVVEHVVRGRAGALAVFAADALFQIDDHAPVIFAGGFFRGFVAGDLPLLESAKGREHAGGQDLRRHDRSGGRAPQHQEIAAV